MGPYSRNKNYTVHKLAAKERKAPLKGKLLKNWRMGLGYPENCWEFWNILGVFEISEFLWYFWNSLRLLGLLGFNKDSLLFDSGLGFLGFLCDIWDIFGMSDLGNFGYFRIFRSVGIIQISLRFLVFFR